jgi:hypothetical protein
MYDWLKMLALVFLFSVAGIIAGGYFGVFKAPAIPC